MEPQVIETPKVTPPPVTEVKEEPKEEPGKPVIPVEATKPDEPPKEEDKLAPKFAALSRRERDQVQKERALKTREAKIAEVEKDMELLRSDPLAFLEAKGVKYEDLTQRKLNGGQKPVSEELKEIRAEQAALKKEKAEQAAAAAQSEYDKQQKEHINMLGEQVKSSAFENLKSLVPNPGEVLYEVQYEHWNRTKNDEGIGEMLSFDEAAKYAEKHLEEETEKWLGSEVIQKRLLSKGWTAPKKEEKSDTPKPSATPKTLTNSQAAAPVAMPGKLESPDEAVRRITSKYQLFK